MSDNRATELKATLGGDKELLDLAHHAWSIAVCAMQGMPIPASWGNAVEKGLRDRGIDVDELPYVVPDVALGDEECEPTEETVGNYTRWHELFGTPERAARTLLYVLACKDSRPWVACEECPILGGCAVRIDGHDALLEWLKDDAE